jgi:hypothetical protein
VTTVLFIFTDPRQIQIDNEEQRPGIQFGNEKRYHSNENRKKGKNERIAGSGSETCARVDNDDQTVKTAPRDCSSVVRALNHS